MTLIVAYLSLCIAAKGTLGSTHSLEFKSGPPESTGFSLVKSLNNLAVPRPSCSKGQTIYNSFIAYSNLVTTRNAVASTKVTITAAKIKKDTHLCILVCQQSAWFPIDSGAPENEGIEKVKVHLKFAGCEADNVGEVAKACNDEKAAPCMKRWIDAAARKSGGGSSAWIWITIAIVVLILVVVGVVVFMMKKK